MEDKKKNECIFKEPATPLSAKQLIDQTLWATPVPKATSTANRDEKKALTPLPVPKINRQSVENNYMSDLLKQIETMKEQVDKQVLRKSPKRTDESVRQSVESEANSSLGLLKQDDLQGLEVLETSNFRESEMKKDLSQRFAKELGRQSSVFDRKDKKRDSYSLSKMFDQDKRNSGFMDNLPGLQSRKSNIDNRCRSPEFRKSTSTYSSGSNCVLDKKSPTRLSPFKDFDKVSILSEEFISGDAMANKLLEDEKVWAQENSILHTQKMSLSGVLEGDKSRSGQDKMSLSSFMRQGSCPLGSLGESSSQEQRPTFGRLIKSPEKQRKIFPIISVAEGKRSSSELDKIPTKDVDSFHNESTYNDRDRLSSSTVSSVASASQIADILSNMSSNTTPCTLVNKVLSKAKSRKRSTLSSEGYKSNEKKYNFDLQKSFSEICNDFKKKTLIPKQEQENIYRTPQKNFTVGEGHRKRVLKALQLAQHDFPARRNNHPIINSPDCDSEKSTRYSSSIDSSLDLSDFKINSRTSIGSQDFLKEMYNKKSEKSESSGSSVLRTNNTVIITSQNNSDQASSSTINNHFTLLSEDECDAAELYVCVATPVGMDFDLINKTENPQKCNISKRVYVNGKISHDAALIDLEKEEVLLDPHSTLTIGVTITPWLTEPILVNLDIKREDLHTKEVKHDTVSGKIIGELPELRLMSDQIISFDPLHEGCTAHQFIILYNSGKSDIPLTLKIIQDNSYENSVFTFDGQESVTILVPHGQEVKQKIDCFGIAVNSLSEIKAHVEVSLTISLRIDLPELYIIPVTTVIAPCQLYTNESDLILQPAVKNNISLENRSTLTMNLSVIPPAGVMVQPNTLELYPGQRSSISVGFDSNNVQGKLRDGSLITIQVLPNGRTYNIILRTRRDSCLPTNSVQTPQSSRATSPMSFSSSVASAEGNMQLECTHTTLVWGSYPVYSKTPKNCMLRNRSMHREKLLISISGSNKCFKLVKDQTKLVDQLQISLQSMESTSLTVIMLPTGAGAFASSLCITRINNSTEKKVLPLYGYGGKAKLIPQSVSRDPEQRMWIYLDNNLITSFYLKNSGDASAFVKISQGMEVTGISISPPEFLILPGSSVRVEVSLTTTAERLEYLLSQPGDATVSVTKLTLTFGDESTRHRLNRLYRKLRTSKEGLDDIWNSRLMILSGLFSDKDMEEVSILRDPVSSLETLWYEGIREWNIGVLVERSLLETMHLDFSLDFVGLENTSIEDTVYNPMFYRVTPPSLNFPSNNCSQELTLQNLTDTTVSYECQSTPGICAAPNKGFLSSISPVIVTVSWIEPEVSTSQNKINIIFDGEDTIEVPISCKQNINTSLEVEKSLQTNLGVYSDDYSILFPATAVGGKSMCRVKLFNPDKSTALVKVKEITAPFSIGISEFILKGMWYINLRLVFRPTSSEECEGILTLNVNDVATLTYKLFGKGIKA